MGKTPVTPFWVSAILVFLTYFCVAIIQTATGPPAPLLGLVIAGGLWIVQFTWLILRRRIGLVIFLILMTIQFLGGVFSIPLNALADRDVPPNHVGIVAAGLLILLVFLHVRFAGKETDG